MKSIKLFALAAVAAIVVACGGGNPMVGSWAVETMTMNGQNMETMLRERMMAGLTASTNPDSAKTPEAKDSLAKALEASITTALEEGNKKMKEMRVTFNEDMTYTMAGGPREEKGKWALSEDKKKITFTPDGGGAAYDMAVEMMDGKMKISGGAEGMTTEMTLIPAAAADVANAVGNAMGGDSTAAH